MSHSNIWQFDSIIDLHGYPRGIAIKNNKLIVGLSRSRNVSRSRPDVLNYQTIEFLDSKLLEINLLTRRYKEIMNCTGLGFEIYDLCFFHSKIALKFKEENIDNRIKEMESTICNLLTLNKKILHQNELINALLTSHSWRLTAPLRKISSYFKKRI